MNVGPKSWMLGALCFVAVAQTTDANAWMLPAIFCFLIGLSGVLRNGR